MTGYNPPPGDELDQLIDRLRSAENRIAELERPSGSQVAQAVKKLQALVDGLLTQVNGIYSGYVQAGGNITSTGGRGTFAAGLSSAGASSTDLSAVAGGRQPAWQMYSGASTGLYGFAPSSFRKKTHWRKAEYTASQFLACVPYIYEYRAQVAIRDDPRHPDYDPSYEVPQEAGYLAELLIKHGLGQFAVMRDGIPISIDYAGFAAVGMTTIGREHATVIARLEARLDLAGL